MRTRLVYGLVQTPVGGPDLRQLALLGKQVYELEVLELGG
jgi:hypothetical protein